MTRSTTKLRRQQHTRLTSMCMSTVSSHLSLKLAGLSSSLGRTSTQGLTGKRAAFMFTLVSLSRLLV